jgi:hypothetical protein
MGTKRRELTGEVLHGLVGTRHQLDVHGLPNSRGVGGPLDGALATDLLAAGGGVGERSRRGAHVCDGRNKGEELSEHVCKVEGFGRVGW